MILNVLVDAGPLAALVNLRDKYHKWVCSRFAEIVPPLLTCESVISEACFLVRRSHGGVGGVLGLLDRGVVQLGWGLKEHFGEVSALMRRNANVPMSLADACRGAHVGAGSRPHCFYAGRRLSNLSPTSEADDSAAHAPGGVRRGIGRYRRSGW